MILRKFNYVMVTGILATLPLTTFASRKFANDYNEIAVCSEVIRNGVAALRRVSADEVKVSNFRLIADNSIDKLCGERETLQASFELKPFGDPQNQRGTVIVVHACPAICQINQISFR